MQRSSAEPIPSSGKEQAGMGMRLRRLWRFRRGVPVLLQLGPTECGAACLAMILGYHGQHVSLAQCAEWLGLGRDGATARSIATVAQARGLQVKAFSLEPNAFEHVRGPAIAHWGFNHFVVVERWSPDSVTIVDPAAGRRRLSTAEFDAGFTGVVLTFAPDAHFRRQARERRGLWRRYLLSMLPMRSIMVQILIISLAIQAIGLALPAVMSLLVDQVLPLGLSSIMGVLGIGLLLLFVTQLCAGYLRATLLLHLQVQQDTRLTRGLFAHLLSLPLRYFERRSSGDLLARLGSNTIIRETLTSQTLTIVLDGALAVSYLSLLLIQAPLFGLLVAGIGLLHAALLLGTGRPMLQAMQQNLMAQSQSQSSMIEALSGIASLKASGAEERVFEHWSPLFFKQLHTALQRDYLAAVIDTALSALRMFAPIGFLWFGALWVIDGTLSLGTMLAYNAIAIAFLTPLGSLITNGQRLQLVGAHWERLVDIWDAAPEQEASEQAAPRLNGRIELSNVSFRYAASAPLVLHDISLSIAPGQKVALVGRTGSGKSTLARLLLGLYEPSEGTLSYDGVPLQQLNYRALRSRFGVVLQEPFVSSGSIRSNISFNDPTLAFERVVEAARLAAIHDDIRQMPMGYETLLAESGGGLSGGQRQRLALARALATRPSILVLDEATSHLDAVTERQIEENINSLACTRIVIAHRLSTIRNADLILVMHEGRPVEQGTHDELLARGGLYAALALSQTPAYAGDRALDPGVSSGSPVSAAADRDHISTVPEPGT